MLGRLGRNVQTVFKRRVDWHWVAVVASRNGDARRGCKLGVKATEKFPEKTPARDPS